MRKTRQLLATAALLMCAAAVTPARAQEGPDDDAPDAGGDMVFVVDGPLPLMGVVEDGDLSMVPSAELFLASLPETQDGRPVFLAQGGGPGGHGPGMFPKELEMTDDQWEKLYAVVRDYNAKVAPKAFEMRQQMQAMKELCMEGDVDRTKAASIQAKLNSLHADIANMKLDKKLNMMAVLTPEQRKALHMRMLKMCVMKDFMGGHGKMRGHMRHHRGGGMGGRGGRGPGGPGGPGPGGPGGPGPS